MEILKFCDEQQIRVLDTASVYGNAEIVLGEAIQELNVSFDIITKLHSANDQSIAELVVKSRNQLKQDSLYGLLYHSYEEYKRSPERLEELIHLKKTGIVQKIGFSLYCPEQVEELLGNKVQFDLVQVPYSVFDQRFDKVFEILKDNDIEIHTRSCFLQGLFFKNEDSLGDHFSSIKIKLKELKQIFEGSKIPLAAGLLNFALLNSHIDKVVIGVDSLNNLKDNLDGIKFLDQTVSIYERIKEFREEDLNILLPMNWKND
jgi:aryl-alcohol dehydrogenase-like predicted oxidoreductase